MVDFSKPTPKSMKAWTYSKPGPPLDVLTLQHDLPIPRLESPTAVLVKVSHCAINPGGSIVMQLFPSFAHSAPKPWIPELDFSGTVVSVGDKVSAKDVELQVGKEVFGVSPINDHLKLGRGALAEYVIVEADSVVIKPACTSFADASGLGVVACTALLLLRKAALKAGEKVLVIGGSGGAGSIVLQLARKAVGNTGEVIAVCSTANSDLVKSLGANKTIDYKTNTPVHECLALQFAEDKFDCIIDAVGIYEIYSYSGAYLKPGKTYVSIGMKMDSLSISGMMWSIVGMMKSMALPRILGGGERAYAQVTMMAPEKEDLREVARLVDSGELRSVTDSEWAMEDALKGYERYLNGGYQGKIVIKVAP